MFADMKVHRVVNVWTNSKSYYLENGKLVDTSTILTFDNQKKGFGKLVVLLSLLITTSLFLGLWYGSWRKQNKQTNKQI